MIGDGHRTITLWQPWATLVALGDKMIETRSWAAPPAAIGERLLIHAAARAPEGGTRVGEWMIGLPSGVPRSRADRASMVRTNSDYRVEGGDRADRSLIVEPLPLGAIVATSVLAACVPMVDGPFPDTSELSPRLVVLEDALWLLHHPEGIATNVEEQRPYGDFRPGRWAWVLKNIEPTTEACPADCWPICMPDDPDQDRGRYRIPTDPATALSSWDSWIVCPTCAGAGSCPPVPAKGGQRVWRWRP